ncbi:RtcB family protein [Luteolibacter flavescens]|uniref:3'-phosphate/5'-hydroxy nucleic acid ligase n=1 Tax=Luteolibacter flavescens TaxID=1859460 RepID=A0ABT3FIC3_9BACT|nr:RtcB family protein [Luteolibacter flavescens]MCW1883321.1 RtcB family protein [Luteolibacter flavescens]
MKLLCSQDLIDAGYEPGLQMKALLDKVAEYESRGIADPKYALKLLKRDVAPPPPKGVMRENPAPLAQAIVPETKEEKENVEAVKRQMHQLLKTPVIARGVILPDACPSGKEQAVIPVGGAIAVENAIIPSAHSADICCSMFATFYDERSSVAKELDALMSSTRFGPEHRHLDDLVRDPVNDENVWQNRFLTGLRDRARTQIADQGDGNHFAYLGEVDVDEPFLAMLRLTGHGDLADRFTPRRYRVLVTHHGSRSLGAHVFKRGQIAAEKHVARTAQHIPPAAAWIDANSDTGRDYWHALQYVARWTKANHRAIHQRFLERIGSASVAEIGNEHNFVWQRGDTFYHGKGATPAWKDEQGRPQLGLIPLNMAEPILLVLGGDRDEFLSFAPHGAGRNLSRTAMRKKFPDQASRRHAIERSTKDIDVRWYCGKPDLSETPLAYKNAAQVRAQIGEFGLAEIIAEIRPLGCIMAGDSGRSWRDREEELTPKQKRQIQHRAERRRVKQDLMDDF